MFQGLKKNIATSKTLTMFAVLQVSPFLGLFGLQVFYVAFLRLAPDANWL